MADGLSKIYPESWARLQLVNSTAAQFQTNWLGLLTLGAYLVASVSGLRHNHLFLDSPIKLPLLSVELPLLPFFLTAPILFAIYHVFVLLKFQSINDKLENFYCSKNLEPDIEGCLPRQFLTQHFSSLLILQAITDIPWKSRLFRLSLAGLPVLTLLIFPALVLFMMILVFLPYQSGIVSTIQGIIFAADILLAFYFLNYHIKPGWKSVFGAAIVVVSMLSVMMVSISVVYREQLVQKAGILPSYLLRFVRLSPVRRDFVDDRVFTLQNGRVDIALRGRSFVGPNLDFADVRGIDFAFSNFRFASMKNVRARRAIFKAADFYRADVTDGDFTRAVMNHVKMQGADLFGARFDGALMKEARLEGTNLQQAHFDGVSLKKSILIGANLFDTRFIGANLKKARLMGSFIGAASFLGAELKMANFRGVMYRYWHLVKAHGVQTEEDTPIHFCGTDLVYGGQLDYQSPNTENGRRDIGPNFLSTNIESTDFGRSTLEEIMIVKPILESLGCWKRVVERTDVSTIIPPKNARKMKRVGNALRKLRMMKLWRWFVEQGPIPT